MAKAFASAGDLAEKKISFTEIGRDRWAFTAEGDPNTGVIIGDYYAVRVLGASTYDASEIIMSDKTRAYDEARDIETPRIWIAERDQKMWEELQG